MTEPYKYIGDFAWFVHVHQRLHPLWRVLLLLLYCCVWWHGIAMLVVATVFAAQVLAG